MTSNNNQNRSKSQFFDLAQAEIFLRSAVKRVEEADYQGALINFEQALKINPNYCEAYMLRSLLIYAPLENHAAVISDYNQVLRINPKNGEAYNNRGYAYALLGNYLEALRDYDRALQINPYNVKAYINRGLSHVSLQDYDKAILDFSQALQIEPQNADAYNNLGASYFNLKNYQIALANLNQALKLNPNYTQAYLNRGCTNLILDKYIEAIADFDRALKLDPQFSKEYFKKLEQQLEKHLKYQNIEDLLNQFNEDFSEKLFSQGCHCNRLGDVQGAIEAYTLALEINPRNTYAYNNRGLNYFWFGDLKDALDDFERALQIDPSYTLAYLNRSRTLICMGKYLESIEDIEKALKFDPECCDEFFKESSQNLDYILMKLDKQFGELLLLQRSQGLLLQGKARHDAGDYYKAIEYCNKVISTKPPINFYMSEVYRVRSLSYAALGYLAEAMADLKKAMSCR